MERSTPPIKPLPLIPSLAYFAVPALAFVVAFHWLMPWLIARGWLSYYAYLFSLTLPLAGMLIASLVALRIEGWSISWQSIVDRFRVRPMDGKQWLWSLGGTILGGIIGYGAVGQLSGLLIRSGVIPIPAVVPAFLDPRSGAAAYAAYGQATGGLVGNPWPALAFLVTFFFNIVGEEFWWRGVILPRQELALGRWAWVIHGLLWALFHVFKWWDILNLLPITLTISYVCSRFRNTTPGLVIHGIVNGIGIIPFILGIFGVLP